MPLLRFYSASASTVIETTMPRPGPGPGPMLPPSCSPTGPPDDAITTTTTTTTSLEAEKAASGPPDYDIRSGIILTRAPLLTRELHPLENAFFFYQKRLEQRLSAAYIPAVHFKPDTPRRIEWDLKVGERQGSVAKELGAYQPRSVRAWDDELVVGDPLSEPATVAANLLRDARARVSEDAEIIDDKNVVDAPQPMPRTTDADARNDVRRLDRKLDRTLYLVVKGADGWEFPTGVIDDAENLHQAAKRILDLAAGVNMNTWIVGRVPIAHVIERPFIADDGTVKKRGRRTFLLRGRIMAGQANLEGNPLGYTDFKWLTREELEGELSERYFGRVRNTMADR